MTDPTSTDGEWRFDDLRALYVNCTLKRSPEPSLTGNEDGVDPGSGGPDNDFTNRNTTFATWNLLHLGALLKRSGGIPAYGNQRSEWDAGCRFDFENPEHR